MSFINKFLTGEEEEEYENSHNIEAIRGNIKVFCPSGFNETSEIANYVKAGNAAIINYAKTPKDEAQRSIDLMTGLTYGIDGKSCKIGHSVVLCVPQGVDVENEYHDEED